MATPSRALEKLDKSDSNGAAIWGLFGALVGGAVSAILSNMGLDAQFEDERSAQVDDLRRAAYVEYVKAVDDAYLATSAAELEPELRRTDTTVRLLSDDNVQAVVEKLTDAALTGEGDILALRAEFIDAAQEEREQLGDAGFLWW